MNILVPIKRVIDYNVVVQIHDNHRDVVTDNVKMSINPFDEIALEEAIRLVESGDATSVDCVAIGCEQSQEQIRQALAMGADKGILVPTDDAIAQDPLCVAQILQRIATDGEYDLVLMGKQAIDNDCNQTGQMLAGLMDWPQATFASELKPSKSGGLEVAREVDGGTEVLRVKCPAVVTVDLRLNEPRYISLPNIMQAKQKPLESISLDDLGMTLSPLVTRDRLDYPAPRQSGQVFVDVDVFLKKLDEDGIWD
tara:strand:+ start:503 stop:1261 length:759 start_codon:yes stop_codon:yes gene_type:complete